MKLLPIAILPFVLLISACSEAPDTQSQSQTKSPTAKEVAEATKPAAATEASQPAAVTEAPQPAAVKEAFKAEMAAVIPTIDTDEEKCEIDPITGKKVCSSGFCGVFGGLCDQFPFTVMKIPFNIAFNTAKTFGSGALTVAKTGLETTEVGTKVVNTVSGAWRQAKRSIIELLSDDPMEMSNNVTVKPKKVASGGDLDVAK